MTNDGNATIEVYPDRTGETISPNLFGLHLEHIWNCVYPCVWVGPESDIPNTDGIRNDTVDRLAALRPTVCKYPGGYFTDFYDWRDGIGPRKDRPARQYPCVPGGVESNAFGTAEFVTFCQMIGAEPYLSVNTISLQPNDAAQWVEYCNGTGESYWANKRREQNYEEPFNVRYWGIGNECYWLHTAEAYAEKYRHWAHWMSNIEPSITLVVGGMEPGQDGLIGPCNPDGRWAERFIEASQGLRWWRTGWQSKVEENQVLYSFHPYFHANARCTPEEYGTAFCQLSKRLPESIAVIKELLDAARGDAPRPKLVFGEYGLLHPGTRMEGNMTQPAPFWAALWLGAFFQICFEHAEDMGIMTHPGPINMEHALLLLEEDQVITTPSYHLFGMFREFGGAKRLESRMAGVAVCPAVKGPALRVCAGLKPGGRELILSVLNLSLTADANVRVTIHGRHIEAAKARVLCCDDIHACNSAVDPSRIVPVERRLTVGDHTFEDVFARHSASVCHIALGA